MARYAEDQAHQVGARTEHFYPNAHLYRAWVIDAFNRDLPYDEFVRLQLAADAYQDADSQDLPALGFLGLGHKYYSRSRLEVMADEWEDRVDTVSRAFLGLTVACARWLNSLSAWCSEGSRTRISGLSIARASPASIAAFHWRYFSPKHATTMSARAIQTRVRRLFIWLATSSFQRGFGCSPPQLQRTLSRAKSTGRDDAIAPDHGASRCGCNAAQRDQRAGTAKCSAKAPRTCPGRSRLGVSSRVISPYSCSDHGPK